MLLTGLVKFETSFLLMVLVTYGINKMYKIAVHLYHYLNRMTDQFVQSMFAVFDNSPKSLLYKHVVSNNLCLQPYFEKPIALKYKHILSKYRLSAHNLSIETGRYHHIDRNFRICSLCNMNILEDEYHFVLMCPFYSTIRDKCIKPYY